MESPNSYFTWWNRDRSNTYEIRLDRVDRFRRMCEDLGLLEDHVMSDTQPGAEHIPPVPTKFLGEFRASCVDVPDLCEQERKANGKIAERLDEYIRASRPKVTPAYLLGKALSSVRRHGLRTSVRRGREWMKLNLH